MHISRSTAYLLRLTLLMLLGALVASLHHHFPSYTAKVEESDDTGASTDRSLTEPAFLHEEEAVMINKSSTTTPVPLQSVRFEYVEVKESCGVHFEGECVRVRTGPGTDFPVVNRLRNHVVLRVEGKVEHDGQTWYKIVFDETLRYPERITTNWYIAADFVDILYEEGPRDLTRATPTVAPTQRILVDISEQKLYAYEDDTLFMEADISTGLEVSPTPQGIFAVFRKTPSRFMQGPLPNFSDVYDLPGVPWNLYFTHGGAVIHGAYWHESFGRPYSHGCVNMRPEDARTLYYWTELGTSVIIRE